MLICPNCGWRTKCCATDCPNCATELQLAADVTDWTCDPRAPTQDALYPPHDAAEWRDADQR